MKHLQMLKFNILQIITIKRVAFGDIWGVHNSLNINICRTWIRTMKG
jgi:hypothetical protein